MIASCLPWFSFNNHERWRRKAFRDDGLGTRIAYEPTISGSKEKAFLLDNHIIATLEGHTRLLDFRITCPFHQPSAWLAPPRVPYLPKLRP